MAAEFANQIDGNTISINLQSKAEWELMHIAFELLSAHELRAYIIDFPFSHEYLLLA
jgi:hypothetical protein